jgi:4-amino-4-deoxy-L-arabinose transferase
MPAEGIAHSSRAAAAAAYAAAFLSWRRGAPRAPIAWVIAGGVLLRLHAGSDAFVHDWDERFHALVAKNLIAHPLKPTLYETPFLPYDPRDWMANHVWLHKPPLALWAMAASMAAFGASEWALRLPSLVLSAAALYATYRTGLAWKGRSVGLVAAFLHSITAILVLQSSGRVGQDHVDTALVAFVGLAVAAVAGSASPSAFAALGLFSGLAVLSKWWPGLLPLAIGVAWHLRREPPARLARRAALALAVCLAVVLPWTLYAGSAYPQELAFESAQTTRHFTEVIEGHGGGPLFHVLYLPRLYGELAYLPLALFFYGLVRGRADDREQALAAWILVPYAIFSAAATKLPPYVLIAAPALFLVTADFLCRSADAGRSARGGRRLALGAAVALLVALPVRILLHDMRVFRSYDRSPAWAAALRELGTRLRGSNAVVFGTPRPVETMFYTSQTAYSALPDEATVRSLQARGYRVLVHDPGDLPDDKRGWAGVEYLR